MNLIQGWGRPAKSTSVGYLPGRGKPRFGFIFCLLALLTQLILPLAHQCHCHQHALEDLNATVPLGAGQEVNLSIQAAESEEEEHHSHHDPATCPICQAAFRARCLAVPTVNLAPALSLPVQHFCNNYLASVVADPDILVLGPRAPPVSL